MRTANAFLSSAALVAAPVAAQTPTIKNSAAVLSQKSGKPVAKTWAEWWTQLKGLPDAKPPVGDAKEPELGLNLDKMPDYVASNFEVKPLLMPAWGSGAIAEPVSYTHLRAHET